MEINYCYIFVFNAVIWLPVDSRGTLSEEIIQTDSYILNNSIMNNLKQFLNQASKNQLKQFFKGSEHIKIPYELLYKRTQYIFPQVFYRKRLVK